jgi:hypothetical protein
MIRLVAIASLLAGCRISLEDDTGSAAACTIDTSSVCMEATTHSDLAWIEDKVFNVSCNFSTCHASAAAPGKLDLRPMFSHDALVNVASMVEPSRKLVVPNDVEASYLMLMLQAVPPGMASPPGSPPPSDIGFMPQNAKPLCCQKLDVIERWIMAGAPPR